MTPNKFLTGAALTLAMLAAVAGSPFPVDADRRSPDRGAVVDVVDVAQWIRGRREGLQIVDVRSAESFTQFNIPTARNIPIAELGVGGLDTAAMVVVYGDIADVEERARVILDALGFDSVFVLPVGADQWVSEILNPMVARDASDAERAAFDRVAELSRYFGGLPRVVERVEIDRSARGTLEKTLRRGCAFLASRSGARAHATPISSGYGRRSFSVEFVDGFAEKERAERPAPGSFLQVS